MGLHPIYMFLRIEGKWGNSWWSTETGSQLWRGLHYDFTVSGTSLGMHIFEHNESILDICFETRVWPIGEQFFTNYQNIMTQIDFGLTPLLVWGGSVGKLDSYYLLH